MRNLTPCHVHAGFPRAYIGEVGLAVPRVEGAMVAALTASGEHEIVGDKIAPTKPVIGVDSGTGAVEEHVSHNDGLGGLGLAGQ